MSITNCIFAVSCLLFAWAILKTISTHFCCLKETDKEEKIDRYRIDKNERVEKEKLHLDHELQKQSQLLAMGVKSPNDIAS